MFSFQTYDNFIEKTKAELNKKPDLTPDTESQIKDSNSIAEQSSIKTPSHRYQKTAVNMTFCPSPYLGL